MIYCHPDVTGASEGRQPAEGAGHCASTTNPTDDDRESLAVPDRNSFAKRCVMSPFLIAMLGSLAGCRAGHGD